MCNCSSFNGNDDDMLNVSHDFSHDFDAENTEFDNFLTKKGRERRKLVKEGKASGLSSKDARKEALASLPRAKLNELIGKIRNGENLKVIQTPLGDVVLDSKVDEKLNELSGALDKENVYGDGGGGDAQPSFFEKNKLYIIGAIVIVGGFIVYKKFIAKG
jgi:hypothetical protein